MIRAQVGWSVWLALACLLPVCGLAQQATTRGDQQLAAYFAAETAKLANSPLHEIDSLETWKARREGYRQELLEMLGLAPLPEKTPLEPVITAVTDHPEFRVERLQFQSRPGLYVTGNLYLPKERSGPVPAILYVCGHGQTKKDGISYGSKPNYQHHGGWFARNGYACLIIDTLQLGEIEGIHHGTYRYNMWWWLNRGYTPAGVEAWNCVRALDYLETRPEIDAKRLGVTGRSGGGAYSWWIAAIDERIQVAVPVAGITDLQNYVVDGCVEGHCDCMFMVNTYRWDYPMLAALVAPRPLLISNTDSDGIFPLDGVVRTFEQARKIYSLYGAKDQVALNITAGGHKDTQELQVHAFRWFNQHLQDSDRLVEDTAIKFFAPEDLKVFAQLPTEERNTQIHESFTELAAEAVIPENKEQWQAQSDAWRKALLTKAFGGWPGTDEPLDRQPVWDVTQEGVRFQAFDFTSQGAVRLRVYLAQRADLKRPELVVLNVLDQASWNEFLATMRVGFEKQLSEEGLPAASAESFEQLKQMFQAFPWAMAYVAPRGVGPTAWDATPRKQIQNRRRFYLLGQTWEGMQVYDVRRAIQALRAEPTLLGKADAQDATSKPTALWLQSHRQMAAITLYASLFESNITRLDLYELPHDHRDGPVFLNIDRIWKLPQAVAMAAESSRVVIYDDQPDAWKYARDTVSKLGWDTKQLQLRKPPSEP